MIRKGKAPVYDSWKQVKEQRVKPSFEQKMWSTAQQGWTKLNVDVAFDPSSRSSGEANVGIVIRDYSGKVLLIARKHGICCVSVEDVGGVCLSNKWMTKPNVIESDCHNVVNSLISDAENRASFSNIVKEIKSILSAIHEVKVCKIGRECNKVARELAQLAKWCMHLAVWRDQSPTCVHELIRLDCKPLSN